MFAGGSVTYFEQVSLETVFHGTWNKFCSRLYYMLHGTGSALGDIEFYLEQCLLEAV